MTRNNEIRPPRLRRGQVRLAALGALLAGVSVAAAQQPSAERIPPSQAPVAIAIPSSSVVNTVAMIAGSAMQCSINDACPASGT